MKDEIIEISLQQFLKHGIRKMTVQKLVAPMGISTKTVYKFFSDKEELLKHCLLKHYAELAKEFEIIKKESSNPLVTTFKIWHKAIELDFGVDHIFYHDLNYYYPRLQDAVVHKFFKKSIAEIEKLIDTGIQHGYFRKDIIPAVVPEIISIIYSSITRTNQLKKYKLTTTALMQNTITAYLRGICTEKGLKELEKNYLAIIK
jgi:AcrR family transcriptional regulator